MGKRAAMERMLVQPDSVWNQGAQLFSQCIAVTGQQRTLYLAGQTAIDATGQLVGVGNIERQIRLSFGNIAAILAAAGGTLANIVKLTGYFVDITALDTYTSMLGELFPEVRPAQTVVEVSRLALPELLVELDAIAVL